MSGSDEAERLLAARARHLAQGAEQAAARNLLEVVVFELGRSTYSIELAWVRAAFPLRDMTPIPGAPPAFLGVSFERGEFLPLLDPRPLLEPGEQGFCDFREVLVLGREGPELGLAVTRCRGQEILHGEDVDEILDSPDGAERSSVLRGLVRGDVPLVDGRALLEDPRTRIEAPSSGPGEEA